MAIPLSLYEGEELDAFLKEKIHRLLSIVDELKELYQKPDYKMEIRGYEDEIKGMVLFQERLAGIVTDEDGKKKYTNEKQRAFRAMQVLVNDDADYKEAIENLGQAKKHQFDLDVDRQVLSSEIRILEKVIPALSVIYERETLKMRLEHSHV